MGRVIAVLVLAVLGALSAAVAAAQEPRVLRDVVYLAEPENEASQSLDLYLPATTGRPPPLVAFVHSRFWSQRKGHRSLANGFARPLQFEGLAVAIIRHRLAPAHVHPDQARDVAAAVAHLLKNAERYGFDPERVFLAGHSSGAHLAALVALDSSYLADRGVSAKDLAGVIAVSGVYDLIAHAEMSEEEKQFVAVAFPGDEDRSAASPLRHVRPDAAPFLVLGAGDDIPSVFPTSKAFVDALRAAGHEHVSGVVVGDATHFSILDMRAGNARIQVLEFVNGGASR